MFPCAADPKQSPKPGTMQLKPLMDTDKHGLTAGKPSQFSPGGLRFNGQIFGRTILFSSVSIGVYPWLK
jgi:hypothetical protein